MGYEDLKKRVEEIKESISIASVEEKEQLKIELEEISNKIISEMQAVNNLLKIEKAWKLYYTI